MKSDTLILLSFIWIFFDTRSDQYFSPKKSQNILPSKAFTQASCSSSSEGGASGNWQKKRPKLAIRQLETQTGAYFHKASEGPACRNGTRDLCIFPINYKSHTVLVSKKRRNKIGCHSCNLLCLLSAFPASYDRANTPQLRQLVLPVLPLPANLM